MVVNAEKGQTSAEAIPILVRGISEQTVRSKPGKGSPLHKTFQRKRVDDLRRDRGAILDTELSKAIREKLLPEVKNEETAAGRLESMHTLKSITLCITTRNIGFGSVSVFLAMIDLRNVPIHGNIYQFYRVSLPLFEEKMQQ